MRGIGLADGLTPRKGRFEPTKPDDFTERKDLVIAVTACVHIGLGRLLLQQGGCLSDGRNLAIPSINESGRENDVRLSQVIVRVGVCVTQDGSKRRFGGVQIADGKQGSE